MLIFIAIVFFAAALVLILANRRHRVLGGMPTGELVYSDVPCEQTSVLVWHRYGLKGKPDALVRLPSGEVIPVERKKSRAPKRPYEGDLIQATAYCILMEENYVSTPPFMRIQYRDRWFDEPYTLERKHSVLGICEQIRQAPKSRDCHRSHRIAAKCRNCGQRENCDEALV